MPAAAVSGVPVSRAMDTSMGARRNGSKAAEKTASRSRRVFRFRCASPLSFRDGSAMEDALRPEASAGPLDRAELPRMRGAGRAPHDPAQEVTRSHLQEGVRPAEQLRGEGMPP